MARYSDVRLRLLEVRASRNPPRGPDFLALALWHLWRTRRTASTDALDQSLEHRLAPIAAAWRTCLWEMICNDRNMADPEVDAKVREEFAFTSTHLDDLLRIATAAQLQHIERTLALLASPRLTDRRRQAALKSLRTTRDILSSRYAGALTPLRFRRSIVVSAGIVAIACVLVVVTAPLWHQLAQDKSFDGRPGTLSARSDLRLQSVRELDAVERQRMEHSGVPGIQRALLDTNTPNTNQRLWATSDARAQLEQRDFDASRNTRMVVNTPTPDEVRAIEQSEDPILIAHWKHSRSFTGERLIEANRYFRERARELLARR